MLAQPPLWFIVIAFLCALGPLIVFHELGHYWVARCFGVGAEQFSIGFGHEIAGWTDKRGTRWKVGWLPLGGYVKFVGDMNPASQPDSNAEISDDQKGAAFHLRPWWQRFLIVLAGPVANFLLAIAIIAAFIGVYGIASTPNVVVGTVPNSAAQKAGLKAGDRIVSMAGRSIDSFEQIAQLAILYPDQDIKLVVLRGDRRFNLNVHIGTQIIKDRFGQQYRVGLLGLPIPPTRFERVPPGQILPRSVERTAFYTRSMMAGLWQIIAGKRSIKELGGPLKIAQVAGQQASLGLLDFVSLVAVISINLGFINLLPVPVLDGGHLVFYAAEAIRRRPVSERAQEWAFRGGFALIIALFITLTVNDLASFGLFERLGRLIG